MLFRSDANRVPLVTLTLPAELAAVISEALNIEATAAAELLDPSPSCACGIADKARACVCGGGCINEPLPSLPLAEFFGLKKAGA